YSSLSAERPQSSDELATLFSLLSVANRFERVADQAVNVCEEVFYLGSGRIVKHELLRDLKVLFVSTASSCLGLMGETIGRTIALEWPVPEPSEGAAPLADENAYAAVFDGLVDRISELVRGLHGTVTPQ